MNASPSPSELGKSGANSESDLPFQSLAGYSINRWIASGGMGDVYHAYESALDRTVALKVLPPEFARVEAAVGRFKKEAAAAAKLSHPNIVPIYAVGEDQGLHYFAMQYVDGE